MKESLRTVDDLCEIVVPPHAQFETLQILEFSGTHKQRVWVEDIRTRKLAEWEGGLSDDILMGLAGITNQTWWIENKDAAVKDIKWPVRWIDQQDKPYPNQHPATDRTAEVVALEIERAACIWSGKFLATVSNTAFYSGEYGKFTEWEKDVLRQCAHVGFKAALLPPDERKAMLDDLSTRRAKWRDQHEMRFEEQQHEYDKKVRALRKEIKQLKELLKEQISRRQTV